MLKLTSQERRVVLFLLCLAFMGTGTNFLVKKYAPLKEIIGASEDLGKVDLNKADKDMLIGLSGIGEKLAQRIIEYRQQNTNFKTVEELKNIKGMNRYRYEKLKDFLVVK